MSHKPRPWPNKQMALRDDTAERAICAYRQTRRLLKLAQSGQATRAGTVSELYEIKDTLLRIILNMQAADAPIDITALDN